MGLYKGYDPVAGLATNTIVTGFNIFDIKWSDHIINDIQWLRADTFSWHSGDVYVTAYNTLVNEYQLVVIPEETEGSITFKRSANGFKIADESQEGAIFSKYNADGVAWYYILDTANKRFKLPRTKFGFEGLRGNVGNDIAESLPNITGYLKPDSYFSESSGAFQAVDPGIGAIYAGHTNVGYAFNFDASRSSSTYKDNAPVQERATQMYLYFYVGEYSREAIEQTAGITSEQLNNKEDIDTWVYFQDGTSGYRYNKRNGYCEQWGVVSLASNTWTTVTFLKEFKDTDYNISLSCWTTSNSFADGFTSYWAYTTKTIQIGTRYLSTNNQARINWKTCGYLADGEY